MTSIFLEVPRHFEEDFDELQSLALSESTVGSEISWDAEENAWDLPYYVADDGMPSCTIEVYDRDHQHGHSVWFRASYNGSYDYYELEGMEIVNYVADIIDQNPQIGFYIKTKLGKNADAPAVFFETGDIMLVLETVLDRATCEDGIRIPKRREILETKKAMVLARKRAMRRKKKIESCWFSWLVRGLSNKRSASVDCENDFKDRIN
ncbi:hypothetical protein FisN_29Lh081 [Fistulifera solaris]|uniref:Uncharacterized protein n=1 Tax=Fistulifera solaris TaxID=1519565 RepID=A0A1Z5JLK7_FISSO|nr:hypothetical protein FisN_29Lh081 [Fistulifera solaris]|eukprot:GAX14869.1 hypothetical protein FisN_29Lh081 [Fistulifera solaris]